MSWLFKKSESAVTSEVISPSEASQVAASPTVSAASPALQQIPVPIAQQPITIAGKPIEEFDFNGLQIIHETPDFEYHAPLTFGEEHEMYLGGHLPNTMPHINFIQDILQYLHDTIGKFIPSLNF